jgi:lipoate-protein ligase A
LQPALTSPGAPPPGGCAQTQNHNRAGPAAEWRLVLGSGLDGVRSDPAADPSPDAGALNMAVDQALFAGVQAGGASVLRLYRWCPACLSLGRHQRALGVYDPERARARGIDVVRRPTGGLAVLHDAELTYAVVAPVRPLGGARAAYRSINQALVSALRSLGVPADMGSGEATHTPHPDAVHPCFERPAPGEVVVGTRKLVGSAQRVERHTLLQHGSILLSGTQDEVVGLQSTTGCQPLAGTETEVLGPQAAMGGGLRGEVTLADLLGEAPPWPRLLEAIRDAFSATFGIRFAPAALEPAEKLAVASELARFGTDSWTWRR